MSLKNEKKMFWFKLKLVLFIISSWWLVAIVNMYLNYSLSNLSIQPHSIKHIFGIFTYPFIHGDIDHLINNSLSAFMIFSSLFLIYEKYSLKVLLTIYIFSGVLLWFIGEEGSRHIGASSIIYGVAFYLFLSGFFVRESSNIAISLLIVAWYGSMIWGITPYTVEDGISWEGHLSGAIIGSILAIWHHKDDLLSKKDEFEEDDDNDDFHFYDRYPIEEEEDIVFQIEK